MLKNSKAGVTLVELSIVLVVIALIVGAVLGGKKLTAQAEIVKLGKEFEQIKHMVANFKYKYEQYPGDINNAYDYWGSGCDTTPSKCNGDNNGAIAYGSADDDRETHRLWQHLSLAGLTESNYSGQGDSSSGSGEIYYSATQILKYHIITDTELMAFSNDVRQYDKISLHGGAMNAADWGSPGLTMAVAEYMDRKIDDGVANTGVLNAIGPSCSAGISTAGGANYQYGSINGTERVCRIKYQLF